MIIGVQIIGILLQFWDFRFAAEKIPINGLYFKDSLG